ncbi:MULTISPECIES: M3 family metallopeptidase [Reichenbachiella]|uniref:Peptidyl-dipeptidase Dcp n=1 Tax=Reichenbachiella agariperforans TaxID=156994 RepID=A0A1M6NJU2_REIAG|nr:MULTISPECIES: M3 family metallopeptidase [Reichenbachiella]RJE71841.1 peptidase M3 [Reichenbachiella sp. MSK19-1]SHJ95894.1 peptidyl-dipeptidase Dcp [Reichenbachiella agariperforans]
MLENNPLLLPFDSPFEVAPFSSIRLEHYKPAIEKLIESSLLEIDKIAASVDAPTYDNTIVALDRSGKQLSQVAEVFFNLNSAETSEEMQALASDLSPILTDFSNAIMQNAILFDRVKTVYTATDQSLLDAEDSMLLEKTYKGFIRSGANLSDEDKKKYAEISKELAQLQLKFGENVLAETNAYEMIIEDEKDLAGLPEGIKEGAAATAEAKGHKGKWMFTLQAPSFVPFMEYADNRALREKMFRAYMSKAFKGDKFDNQENVKKIVALRQEKVALLGYESYSDYVLEERMAESADKVEAFLNDLLTKATPKAKAEVEAVKAFAKGQGFEGELERWDWSYYSQKLKNEKFQINDEMLRPYFKLDNAVKGIFDVANKLYGLTFKHNPEIPVYHPDVKAYEVLNEKGEHVSVFFEDYFPREGKRGGAWMTSYKSQYKDGIDHRPIVSIVCNFTPATGDKPSLLTYNEVETLFHEFGHALHGMLADSKYSSLSGTSVYWDFVELPSQILENWLQEKECLDLFAKHYETGEPIPEDYIQKIKDSSNFNEGYQTMRQLSFGLMDMAWHSLKADEIQVDDVRAFEQKAMAQTELFGAIEGACMSTQFSHIFQGGYAAGYYSYKWAEVLDADAFSVFKEKGIFNKEVATSFKENILSRGGSEHPMELYKRFRGQEPTVDALLERSGLK